ncbi:MarR family winged helix-turn-helix transcriptional regulator [Gluconobacter albidus]|uniref:MarR family winged helix-turn-helix transcriptional regulator n=1 Tax=Gluconobacter albidus TaxID=318683 RepID=UPI003094F7F6
MTSKAKPPELADFICFSLYVTSHAFNRLYQPLLEPLGLTYPQYLVMTVLWADDHKLVGEIGAKLELASSTLTPLLKRLENSHLITRTRSQDDERQVRISLTSAGHDLKKMASSIPGCVLEATGMSIDELRELRTRIDRLHTSISNIEKRS